MKRIASFLLLIAITLSLVACGPQNNMDLEDKIKQDYIDTYLSEDNKTINDIKIEKFYGDYDGSFVAIFQVRGKGGFGVSNNINIGGFEFYLPHGDDIRVWNNNKFYEAEDAYEKNLLDIEDVRTMYSLHLEPESNDGSRFYGSYNGVNVRYYTNEEKTPVTVEIADTEFKFSEGGDIVVYAEESEYNLENDIEKIIKEDILSKKNIATIKSVHDNYNKDQELSKLKTESKEQYARLVNGKDEANYSAESVSILNRYIAGLNKLIDSAFTKGEVNWIVDIFQKAANEVPTIDLEIENKVRQAYYDTYLSDSSNSTINEVSIDTYLGTYNGSYVVIFNEPIESSVSYYNAEEWDSLTLIGLKYRNAKVYNNGTMYDINTAYEKGLIVGENLYIISNIL